MRRLPQACWMPCRPGFEGLVCCRLDSALSYRFVLPGMAHRGSGAGPWQALLNGWGSWRTSSDCWQALAEVFDGCSHCVRRFQHGQMSGSRQNLHDRMWQVRE